MTMTLLGKGRPLNSVEALLKRTKLTVNGCLEWQGPLTVNGYGKTTYDNRTIMAHRLHWILVNGSLGVDFLLHICDNRKCINLDHLVPGSAADNIRDAAAKGRLAYGERHGNSILTTEEVNDIRSLYKDGVYNQVELAKVYNCSQATISRIILRQTRAKG